MTGWVKLHRSTLNWEWYGDPNVVLVFLDLLISATHKKTKYRGYDLNPGDVVYGHSATALRIGLGVQSVRTALDKLKKSGEVTSKVTSKFSIVSITNWAKYQTDQQATNTGLTADQQPANKQLTFDQQATNSIQEGNNINKSSFVEFWNEYGNKQGKADAEKRYKAALKTTTHETIMAGVARYKDHLESVRQGGFNQKTQLPAVWLHKGRWADEYDQDPETGQTSKTTDFVGTHPDSEKNLWKHRIASFRERGFWMDNYGPNPDEDDCEAPDELLNKGNPNNES